MNLKTLVLSTLLSFSSASCISDKQYNTSSQEPIPQTNSFQNNQYKNLYYPHGSIMLKPEPEKPLVWKYGQK